MIDMIVFIILCTIGVTLFSKLVGILFIIRYDKVILFDMIWYEMIKWFYLIWYDMIKRFDLIWNDEKINEEVNRFIWESR